MGREINQLLGRIFAQRHKDGRTDLEAIETAVRSTVHQAGAAALSALLQFPAPAADPRTLPCSCGQAAHYGGLRSKPVLTVVGRVEVSRPYYLCPDCHAGQFPADVELDIENTEFSPGVRRMQALVGQEAPFDHGREQMKVLAGLEVTAKSVERTAEGIGADIAQREQKERHESPAVRPAGRRGRAPSHPVCANGWDGSPGGEERDGGSARQNRRSAGPYAGSQIGMRIHADDVGSEGLPDPRSRFHHLYRRHRNRRGVRPTPLSGSLETGLEPRPPPGGDGRRSRMDLESGRPALSRRHSALSIFTTLVSICGSWHASSTRNPAQAEGLDEDSPEAPVGQGKIEKLVGVLRALPSRHPAIAEKIRTEADYFERNAERMRYPKFRRQHLFVGSGVIEAGCKTVVASRLKRSGNVLDRPRSQRHPGPALRLSQWRL